MFECRVCGRSYARQNSLTRHSHRHKDSRQHECTFCGVRFYRHDLLSRHLKLHKSIDGSAGERSGQNPSDLASPKAPRQRCHTACTRCRELRIRCTSTTPCDHCVNAGKPCLYSQSSGRLSQAHHQTNLMSPESASDDDDGLGKDQAPLSSNDDEIILNNSIGNPPCIPEGSSTIGQGRSLSIAQSPPTLSPKEQPIPRLGTEFDEPPADSVLFDLDQSILLDSLTHHQDFEQLNLHFSPAVVDAVSWPWLHESLYLSGTENDILLNPSTVPVEHPLHSSTTIGDTDHNLNAVSQWPQRLDEERVPDDVHMLPTPTNQSGNTTAGLATCQVPEEPDAILNALMSYASGSRDAVPPLEDHSSFWNSISPRVATAFQIPYDHGSNQSSLLESFINLYIAHFEPLWPLLSLRTLQVNQLQPLLYLVLASIGSMYSTPAAGSFGSALHNNLCTTLAGPLDFDEGAHDSMWLAQARCHTKVASLYFGHPRAFTYAQHLGALLVSQARRMELFSATAAQNYMNEFHDRRGSMSDRDRLHIWLRLEARRRLAFAIFRAETYTSILLHTKPLIYLGEIELAFPSCDAVWRGNDLSPEISLQMIQQDLNPSRDMMASDIYRIALDPDEPLPLLDPIAHELLIFGLQWPVWEFSRDPHMFARLTGQDGPVAPTTVGNYTESTRRSPGGLLNSDAGSVFRSSRTASEMDRLDISRRKMADFAAGHQRLLMALRKWEQAIPLIKSMVRREQDRSSLMSSLLLYHLSHLRLTSPLSDLCQIQYHLAGHRRVGKSYVDSAYRWINSATARASAESAVSIWSLIGRESGVKFNLLAFASLHHSAVLLWSYANARHLAHAISTTDDDIVLFHQGIDNGLQFRAQIDTVDIKRVLDSFTRLFDLISPARWPSYAKAVQALSGLTFPSCPS